MEAASIHLEEADDEEDLELRGGRKGIPHVARRARGRDVAERERGQVGGHRRPREARLDVPREVDAIGVDAVADEAGQATQPC